MSDLCFRLGQEGITIRLRKAAFGSTIRMHMAFFDTPEILGFDRFDLGGLVVISKGRKWYLERC